MIWDELLLLVISTDYYLQKGSIKVGRFCIKEKKKMTIKSAPIIKVSWEPLYD